MSVHLLEPIDTKAELEAGKGEEEILEMIYQRICDKGSEVMGYDVRDYASLKAEAEPANDEPVS